MRKKLAHEVWSVRTLHRNIATQYYFRLLQSANKKPVIKEMHEKTAALQLDKFEFIKNPIVAEFLGLQTSYDVTESKLESSIIQHMQNFIMDMYVRMYDQKMRTEGDNPTIGLLLGSDTSQDMARYSVLHGSEQLFQAKYLTYLPTKEELIREIEQQKEIFRMQQENENED